MTPTTTKTGYVATVPEEYSAFGRIRWSAVLAGTLVALVSMITLNLLGLGIGFASINPTTEANPFSGIGIGAIIWYVIATLISLFAGGYVAGKMSGFPKKSNAGLHGLLTWGLVTLVTLYLYTTAIGRVVSGVGSAISSVTSGVTNTIGAVIPNDLGQGLGQEINLNNINLNKVRGEVLSILDDANKAALDPDNLRQDARQVRNSAQRNAQDVRDRPFSASNDVNQVIDRIQAKGGNVLEAADQDALANVIAERTEMSDAEARREVTRISNELEQASASVKQQVSQFADNAGDTAATVGGDVADALSTAALLGFVALLLGAAAGFFGGQSGRQLDPALNGNGEPTVSGVDVGNNV